MGIQDLLAKVTDESTRDAIKAEYDKVNQERGKFGDHILAGTIFSDPERIMIDRLRELTTGAPNICVEFGFS